MTEPAKIPDVPTVHLNGRDWPIPEFGPRVLRQAREQILAVNNAIIARHDDDPEPPSDEKAAVDEFGRRIESRYLKLDNAHFGMMSDAVYWGLKAAHRDLSMAEFEDWPVRPAEMFSAYLVVRQQSGLYGFRREADQPGEVMAAKAGSQGEE